MTFAFPLIAQPASAESVEKLGVLPYGPNESSRWQWIKTDRINIVFPAGGRKPMFLWWHPDDTSNIYVIKFKGLIEFLTFDDAFYRRLYEATEERMRTMLNERYFGPRQYMLDAEVQSRIREQLESLASYYGLHRPFLPFDAGTWNLTGPTEVTRGSVQYLSFNFTLVSVPFPNLDFAENNVIIRCRFYYTPAEEDVDGLYTYSVDAGVLKWDLIVRNWTWNVDRLEPLFEELAGYGISVPVRKAGLALWMNFASIPIEEIDLAEADLEAGGGLVEASSTVSSMYVEGTQVGVVENRTLTGLEQPLTARARLRERFKVRFGWGDSSVAGFFKYVPKAVIRDGEDVTVVDVRASYISAGHHMRLYLCYPYFGDGTLEHDPSLGLEMVPTLVTPGLLLVLVGAASTITIVVLAVRWKKKTINIVGV